VTRKQRACAYGERVNGKCPKKTRQALLDMMAKADHRMIPMPAATSRQALLDMMAKADHRMIPQPRSPPHTLHPMDIRMIPQPRSPPHKLHPMDIRMIPQKASPKKASPKKASPKSPKKAPKSPKKASPKKALGTDPKSAAQKWAAMYHHGYAPPAWSLAKVGDADWNARAKDVRVYYPNDVSMADLKTVVAEREPVNIGGRGDTAMRHYAPLRDSGYTRLFRATGRLPPNFALYMRALISSTPKHLTQPKVVHVINSIGYGFDITPQPDYQYFMKHFTPAKQNELRERLAKTFQLAFACALDIPVRKVCLCYLGGVAFAEQFQPNQMAYMDFYFDALRRALTPHYLAKLDEINLMGYDEHDYLMSRVGSHLQQLVQSKGKICRLLGRIPQILTSDTLFMNAWDPHSVVGNGNESDASLDGYFGRLSDMGYMSIPEINPFILQNMTRV
jgi:hypothetical protein